MTPRKAAWVAVFAAPVLALECFSLAFRLIDLPPVWSDIGATFFFLLGLFALGLCALCVKYLVEHGDKEGHGKGRN